MKNKRIYLIFALILGVAIFFIAINTPPSGDDWYYEVFYHNENLFLKMIDRYFTTQSRVLAWLTTAFLAGNRWLWNILMPLVFVGIYGCLIKFTTNTHKKPFLISLLTLGFIIVVSATTKYSNYFWLSGSTFYLFPALMILLYILLIFQIVFNHVKVNPFLMATGTIIIGFYQINAVVAVMIALICAMGFDYCVNKKINKSFVGALCGTVFVLIISYISPGAQLRMLTDNPEILNMPLWGRFKYAFPEILRNTFIPLSFSLLIYCFSFSYLAFKQWDKKENSRIKILFLLANTAMTIFYIVLNLVIHLKINIPVIQPIINSLINESYFLSYKIILFSLFTIVVIFSPLIFIKHEKTCFKVTTLVLSAAAANFVLVFSPIQDERMSIFAMFLLSAAALLVFSYIDSDLISDRMLGAGVLLLLTINLLKWQKETMIVMETTKYREAEIQLYRDRNYPKNHTLYLVTYQGILHGADIKSGYIGDEGHYNKFVEIYDLPKNISIQIVALDYYKEIRGYK